MTPDGLPAGASGFVCPRCGGAPLGHPGRAGSNFQCRIGDAFSALELWIEHCMRRNQALKVAARELAENAALARRLAAWARQRGDARMASRLDDEATVEGDAYRHVKSLLDGLEGDPSMTAT